MQIPHFVRDDKVVRGAMRNAILQKHGLVGRIVPSVAFGHGMPCPY